MKQGSYGVGGSGVRKEQCSGTPVWGRSGEEEERCGVRSDVGQGGASQDLGQVGQVKTVFIILGIFESHH